MYELHKKPGARTWSSGSGSSSLPVLRPAIRPPTLINNFQLSRQNTHTRSVVTITGYCSVLSWKPSPCKAWWRIATYKPMYLRSARLKLYLCNRLLVERRPPLLTDNGWGPLLPLGYLERQRFRPLPLCSLIGPLRTSAHTNFTITWRQPWASPENLCVRAAQHRLACSISAVSCFLLPNSSSPTDRHRPRLSLSKPYKAR